MNWQVFDTGEKFLDEVCEMFDGLAVNLEKLRAKLGLETAAEDIGAELLAPGAYVEKLEHDSGSDVTPHDGIGSAVWQAKHSTGLMDGGAGADECHLGGQAFAEWRDQALVAGTPQKRELLELFANNIERTTTKQLQIAVKRCLHKYHNAEIDPGEAVSNQTQMLMD
jgi:hypothetical protein